MNYFDGAINELKPIVKLKNLDFILTPRQGKQKSKIGFHASTKCTAGELHGTIEIRADFEIPDGKKYTIACNNENLNELIQDLEFIKMTDPIDQMNLGH